MGVIIDDGLRSILESINLNTIKLVRSYSGSKKSIPEDSMKVVESHSHSCFEIGYVIDGKYDIYLDNDSTSLQPYNLFFYSPNCIHGSSYYGQSNHHGHVVWFEAEYNKNIEPRCFISRDSSNTMHWLFNQIIVEAKNHDIGSDLIINNLIATILLYTKRIAYSSRSSSMNELIHDAVAYIDINYAAPLNVTQLAEMVNVSKPYFHKMFRSQIGITPLQYLNNVRIQHAKKLLLSSGMSIEEVSTTVGIEDPLYFSRLFKKETGYAPRDWKKMNHLS